MKTAPIQAAIQQRDEITKPWSDWATEMGKQAKYLGEFATGSYPTDGLQEGDWITDTTLGYPVFYYNGSWKDFGTGSASTSGTVAQIVETVDSTGNNTSTVMPYDHTIPQNTEGDQLISASITPTAADSTLIIEANLMLSHSSTTARKIIVAALFQDATANALTAMAEYVSGYNLPVIYRISHKMTAGTTSSTTFKVRAGRDTPGGQVQMNYQTLGGVVNSFIRITEIRA